MTAVGEGQAFERAPDLDENRAAYFDDDVWFDVAPDDAPDESSDRGDDLSFEAPEPERVPHLRVARRPSRDVLHRRRRARLAVFGVAALSAASMFTLVAFHVFAAQAAFTLDKLDTERSAEQRQYGLLRARVATLSSPDAVAKAALAQGMVRPSDVTLLDAPAAAAFGASSGLPAPPATPYAQIAAGP